MNLCLGSLLLIELAVAEQRLLYDSSAVEATIMRSHLGEYLSKIHINGRLKISLSAHHRYFPGEKQEPTLLGIGGIGIVVKVSNNEIGHNADSV